MQQKKRGSIINFSSMSVTRAITRVAGYSAGKAGMENFTRWMACELALRYGDGIRVNAIAPGFFIGEQNRRLLVNPDGQLTDRGQLIIQHTPMSRFGRPEELNGAIHFLSSDASSFVTGTVIPIDGGFGAFSGV
jgi:NAD(P)-dependent dehydrogenase (short-subunit alcohol dehydrogenase family)